MKKVSIIFMVLAVGLASCKKGFLNVNSTPNNPTVVPPTVILPNITIATAFANANDLNRAASVLVQHTAGVANQVAGYDVFNLDGSFDNQWNFEIYNGALNNMQVLIDQYASTSPAYSGIAKLQMAYIMSMTTDLWGDVPYSQAGKGLLYENPRFDKQEDIYQGNPALGITGLLDLVKDGLNDLGKPSVLLPTAAADLVYKGDLAKWRRMGNTLLLKFAIQISNRNPVLAKSTIESVLTGNNYINDNALDFEVPFGSAVGNRNPIFDFNNSARTGDMMLSSRLYALSKSLNDTLRLSKFFTKPANATNTFTAFNNGSTATAPVLSTRSKYNTYLTGTVGGEAPIRLLTNFQVNFILAEAALTLNTPGVANNYYQAGIRASMQKVGIPDTSILRYFNDNPTVVSLGGTTQQQLQQIITQKYMAWIGNGIEAYNDYRRTGYPVLALPLNAAGDNPLVIPTRLPYTPNELARNPNAPNPRPKTDVKLWFAL
jgi:hypothetical protein